MKRYAILAVMTSAIVGWTASSCMAQASLSQLGQQQGGSGAFQQTGQLTTTASNASGTFVGGDSSDVSNFRSLTNGMGGMGMNAMSGMGSMGMGGMGRMGGFGGMGGGGMGRGGQANDPRSQLRIPMRIGFVRPTVDLGLVSIRVTDRLTKIPTLSEGNEVKVAVIEGGVAVVTGSVASERDRSLIERLLELEAGVDEVRNELIVTAGETTPN
jgi:hypothetical protein